MLKSLVVVAAVMLLVLGMTQADKPTAGRATAPREAPPSVYDFTVKDIEGKDVELSKYKGDVLLVVNVASQ